MDQHLGSCPYEALKGYLQATEARMDQLQAQIDEKDDRLRFLANMLGTLSTRVDTLENALDDKLSEF